MIRREGIGGERPPSAVLLARDVHLQSTHPGLRGRWPCLHAPRQTPWMDPESVKGGPAQRPASSVETAKQS